MAIKHLGGNKFSISFMIVSPMYTFGQNPELDKTGATFHLSPMKKYDDIKAYNWLKTNTNCTITPSGSYLYDIVEFESDEDALHFKMVWM